MGRPGHSGMTRVCVGAATVAVAVATFSPPIIAATTTANLNVTANVITSCTVTAGTLAFGDYDPVAGANLDQTGSFQVACTKGTSPQIGLDNGANFNVTRRMTNGTDFLGYEIYKETGRTNIWGNTGGGLVTIGPLSSNALQTQTVYGRVPFGQDVGTGNYTDTVVITVTF